MIKKFIVGVTAVLFALVTPAFAYTIPVECEGMTFDNVVEGNENANSLVGTAGRDLMIGNGGADSFSGLGGDDCIVTSPDAGASVQAGAGNDVVVGKGSGDYLKGGAGNDEIYGIGGVSMRGEDGDDTLIDKNNGAASSARGGAGVDYCVAGYEVGCEL